MFCCYCCCCCALMILLFILSFIILLIALYGKLASQGISLNESKPVPFSDLPNRYFKGLPSLSNHFVGRETEINEILGFLNPRSLTKIVGVFGGPGFGKSTLAIKSSEKLVHDFEMNVEYYDLSDVSFVQYLMHRILGHNAKDVEQTVSLIEELKLWANSKNTSSLLVFNDCDKLFKGSQRIEMQNLVKAILQSSSHIKIIFTSRVFVTFLDGFKSVELIHLQNRHAVELLEKIIPTEPSDKLENIARLVGNVPLALQVVGVLLEEKRISSDRLIKELTKNPIRALSPNNMDHSSQVEASLQLSYQNLDEFTQMCAIVLANLPGSFTEDVAISLINYMVNETYWYTETFLDWKMFLHWIPNPSHCVESLVDQSLLKYHFNSKRYSYHELIQNYMRQVEHEKRGKLIRIFKVGFFNYFVDYWNSFHTMANKAHDFQSLLATIDMERHNFERMETLLLEFGRDISYVNRVFELGETLVVTDARIWWEVQRNIWTRDIFRDRLESVSMLVVYTDCHSKIIIKSKGLKKYMEVFVGLLKERFQVEKYLNEEMALDNFISRQQRIIEIHNEYGNEALEGVLEYFKYIAEYLLDANDIDRYMEVFKTLNEFKSQLDRSCCSSFLEYGIREFSLENYQKAIMYFMLQEGLETTEEYLYTQVLTYYCYIYQGNEMEATKVESQLREFDEVLMHQSLIILNRYYTKVIHAFYNKIMPDSTAASILRSKLSGTHSVLTVSTRNKYCFIADKKCVWLVDKQEYYN